MLAAIAVSEIFVRLDIAAMLNMVRSVAGKAIRVIRSPRISDCWKARASTKYAAVLLRSTTRLLLAMTFLCLPLAVFIVVGNTMKTEPVAFMQTVRGISYITTISVGYVLLRRKGTKSSYNAFDRALHRVALGCPMVAEASFDMDSQLYRPEEQSIVDIKHVFICGLARAGTTVLMRRFHSSGQFRSLTYRDMPFVMAPNLWQRIASLSSKSTVKKERSHGDGLMVDYDSPEALEEVFWRIYARDKYIRRDRLLPMNPSSELITKFRTYVALVLASSPTTTAGRYLSKNNNNLLRLPLIKEAFPNALIIIPFRDPVQQSHSLLHMHERFTKVHTMDPFQAKYMRWLAHHEFGSDHRPFVLNREQPHFSSPDHINHWLELWVNVYQWLLNSAPHGTFFLSYEILCKETDKTWRSLSQKAGIQQALPSAEGLELKTRQTNEIVDTELCRIANSVYRKLQGRHSSQLSD